jgi:hypothetical protein
MAYTILPANAPGLDSSIESQSLTAKATISFVSEQPYLICQVDAPHVHPSPGVAFAVERTALLEITGVAEDCDFLPDAAQFGADGSFLVDMQSISTLISAKGLRFADNHLRAMMLNQSLLRPGRQYFRFGVAGAETTSTHPGGDVIELALIEGEDGSGQAGSVSGYLAKDQTWGAHAPLVATEESTMLEDRYAYSQTAFLARGEPSAEACRVRFKVRCEGMSLLDSLSSVLLTDGVAAAAIRIDVTDTSGSNNASKVTGRLPSLDFSGPWHDLNDAARSGRIRTFSLLRGQRLVAYGTKFPRHEPDWERLSGGKPYEYRGHFHAWLREPCATTEQYSVFHLRDVALAEGAAVTLDIWPMTRLYKIYSLHNAGPDLVCSASGRTVDQLCRRER